MLFILMMDIDSDVNKAKVRSFLVDTKTFTLIENVEDINI